MEEVDAMIRQTLNMLMICPLGGTPPAGLSAARGLATIRAYLVFLVTIVLISNVIS
jgi:hypothetical protein